MNAWLRHHLHSLLRTLGRLASTPIGTALNVVVIGVALALPLGAYVLLVNLQTLAGGFDGYLAKPFTKRELEELLRAIFSSGVRSDPA